MIVQISWPFNCPVSFVFFLKTAGITNEIMHLAVLVFTAGNPINFTAIHPGHRFARAFVAVAMSIHWIEEPHPAFEAESPVSKRAHGAYVNHVSAEIVVNRSLNIGTDLHMVSTVEDAVYALVSELIGDVYTTEAHDTARHVELDVRANVNFFERAALKFIPRAGFAVLKCEIL